ncbi:Phosphoglycerate dehydrogenase [Promicromonospora umidemergens]|uniref:Hydroxyacid dehydrogenase n=1 Tax=Promicromonospora umidemergens TaxID=629679 RepID=A0ABP8Y7M3_9MICO|nr:hydroxyacid dehydrogenase [Promicromonospora umidemergens]MCP2282394.1 Phosphoglycerate dehydrogenase [Promicromonospora umidemergens]
MTTQHPRAVLAFGPRSLVPRIFSHGAAGRLRAALDVDVDQVLTEVASGRARRLLASAEVLIAGWGAPQVPVELTPRLRAVLYAGGVARTCLADPGAHAARGVVASNARAANAVPVAEYTLATILLAGKRARAAERELRAHRRLPDREQEPAGLGNYRRTVGIVGASQVGRRVIELLRPFDLDVVVHSPELTPESAAALGVRCATLEEVAAQSDVLSLHQPLLPETVGQIDAHVLALLPDGATLINTARGAVVDEPALLAELRTGRIDAVLDVTAPEPPAPDSALWDLPNLVLTPHIAGSAGGELHRLGDHVAAEAERFARGLPFAHPEDLADGAAPAPGAPATEGHGHA